MSSALAGRDWSVWEQIDDVVGLAMTRATATYIGYIDTDPQLARNYQGIAQQLAQVKQVTHAHVMAQDPVPTDLVGSPEYNQIDAALAPMMLESDVQDAVNNLPVAQGQYVGVDSTGLDVVTGKPSPMTTAIVVGGIVIAGVLGYLWVRNR